MDAYDLGKCVDSNDEKDFVKISFKRHQSLSFRINVSEPSCRVSDSWLNFLSSNVMT